MVRIIHPADPRDLVREFEEEVRDALAATTDDATPGEDPPEVKRAKIAAMRFGVVQATGALAG